MKVTHRYPAFLLIGVTALTLSAASGASAQSRYQAVTLEESTVIPVVLERELRSDRARRGDQVRVRVRTEGEEYQGIPSGSYVEGRVQEARPLRGNEPGVLDLEFTRLRLPDGSAYPISASLVGLSDQSVQRDSSGRLTAKSNNQKNRNTFIGLGAGAGALIGILTRGGKVSLTDILLGAAAGYAYGEATRSRSQGNPRNVLLEPGTEFGLALNQDVRIRSSRVAERFDRDTLDEESVNDRDRWRDRERFDDRDRFDDRERFDDRDHYADRERWRNRDRLNDRDRRANRERFGGAGRFGHSPLYITFTTAARPYTSNGVWMLPVRNVMDAAQANFRFISSTRELVISDSDMPLRAKVDSRIVRFDDGRQVSLDQPLRIHNGTLYAPMDFFELATGRRVVRNTTSNTFQLLSQ